MVRGFYTAGSGMVVSSRKLDIAGDNMANARTAGYKKDAAVTSAFQQRLVVKLDKLSQQQIVELGSVNQGQTIDRIQTDYEQGTIESTGNPFHLAISGEGFFTVMDGDLRLYTRNGEFELDAQGYVTNANGGRLMGENGPINTGGKLFAISSDGGIYVDGAWVDNLALYSPIDANALVKHGSGMFANPGAAGQQPFTGSIKQGCIEVSNVSMIDEMMEMMKSQRSFQSCSQVIRMIDATLQKAVEIGKMG